MSFLSATECGSSSNPLNNLLKQSQTDRSLQQGDRFGQAGGSAAQHNNAFRQGPAGPMAGRQMDEGFMGQPQFSQGAAMGGAFDFDGMRREMEMMRAKGAPPPSSANWANEMSHMSPANAQNFQSQMPRLGGDAHHAWREQFHQHSGSASPAASQQSINHNTSGMMAGGGGARTMGLSSMSGMGGMGMSLGGMGMSSNSFANQMNARSQQQNPVSTDKGKSRFVELDDASWEAQFKALDEAQAAAEAEAKVQDQQKDKGKGKATDLEQSEEDQDAAVRRALDGMQDEITAEGRDADARFQELWNAMQNSTAGDSAEVEEDLAKWEEELNQRNEGVGYRHPGGGIAGGDGGLFDTGGLDGTEDQFLDGFGTIGADGYPRLGTYRLSQQNPYMEHADPLSEGLNLLSSGGSLQDATLAFEAATAKPQTGGTGGEVGEVDRERRARSEAWRRLGEAQAMNERETQAIRALEEAVRVDEGNLEAYMALAISYINEGYDLAAHSTLERYITRAYPHLKPSIPEPLQTSTNPLEADSSTNPWATLNAVTSLFLSAARENAQRGIVDAEVQVGLGVLFYADSSYEKAEDCFRAALEVRPNDFLLWNRLGATFANGGKPEMAIEAYHKALELRPTFTRAIYNLSVSCLNLGAHHEAAEHLLSALALQKIQTLPNTPAGADDSTVKLPPLAEAQESHGLWSTLRRIFLAMDRMDLAGLAHVGSDLNNFRNEFEF
ncbi:unnamed protein product [Sympodiomycopsis kandeliae]